MAEVFLQPDWAQLTQRFPHLVKLPQHLKVLAIYKHYGAGQSLFAVRSRPQHIFYVLDGEVLLQRTSLGGNDIILHRSRHGFIAEASLRSATYHCDAKAGVASNVLCFPVAAVQASIDADAGLRTWWIDELAQQLRTTRAQCERLALKSAVDRVLHYINSESHAGFVTLHQTRKAWAAELGLSHETLYRTLTQLQDQGVVHIASHAQGFDIQLTTP